MKAFGLFINCGFLIKKMTMPMECLTDGKEHVGMTLTRGGSTARGGEMMQRTHENNLEGTERVLPCERDLMALVLLAALLSLL